MTSRPIGLAGKKLSREAVQVVKAAVYDTVEVYTQHAAFKGNITSA